MATQRLELAARRRTVTGQKNRFLRRAGITPANVYGHGITSVAVEVDTVQLQQTLRRVSAATLVNLNVEDTKEPYTVMIREVQHHPVTHLVNHVDFYQIRMTERLRVEIPVHIIGASPAVQTGEGTLVQNLRTIQVEGLPGELPSSIEVDISGLTEVHMTVYVRDLHTSDRVTILLDPEEHVVSIAAARREEEEEGASPAEPERVAPEREEASE